MSGEVWHNWIGGHQNIIDLNSTDYGTSSPYELGQYQWNRFGSSSTTYLRRVINFTATTGSVWVRMPDATTVPLGGPIYYFGNVSNYQLNFVESGVAATTGNRILMLKANSDSTFRYHAVVFCIDNTTAAGVWSFWTPRKATWGISPS